MHPNFRVKQEKNLNRSESTYVGLQILTTISKGKSENVVSKSSVKPNPSSSDQTFSDYDCYLKTCHLCRKRLRQDRDVYMYRGNLGFCSVECRSRQIQMDERREREVSTRQITLPSYRYCNSGAGNNEVQAILDDLRRSRNAHETHWAFVS